VCATKEGSRGAQHSRVPQLPSKRFLLQLQVVHKGPEAGHLVEVQSFYAQRQ
jgi:hypothetical protein